MVHLILGFSLSGKAMAELLLSKGKSVLSIDRKAKELSRDPSIQPLLAKGVELLDETAEIEWNQIEMVLISPGIELQHPLIKKAKEWGIEVVGEVEFAMRYLKNPIIGITGTNGKTTATLLLTHILNSAGIKARALGNVGVPLSSYVLQADPKEVLVVELSSFQLETLQSQCLDFAICINITPDHLDRYPSMLEYAKAKCRIQECRKENGLFFASKQVVDEFGFLLETVKSFDRLSDVLYLICSHFGVKESQFSLALETFQRPKHRIEFAGKWNDLTFYNDSKATNIDSVIYAVNLLDGPILLLAGGKDKGASYCPWIKAFGSKVQKIIAFGQAAEKMQAELGTSFSFEKTQRLQEALICAVQSAKGPLTILLSPGCSSFDQFKNYEERGNEFKRMIEEKVWIEERRSSLQCWSTQAS